MCILGLNYVVKIQLKNLMIGLLVSISKIVEIISSFVWLEIISRIFETER